MSERTGYLVCPVCGGKKRIPQRKRIGSQILTMEIICKYCQGTGEILASKLKKHPLYDRFGHPVDVRGRVVTNPSQDAWWRNYQRKEYEKTEHGRRVA